jgi:hypothetical protein
MLVLHNLVFNGCAGAGMLQGLQDARHCLARLPASQAIAAVIDRQDSKPAAPFASTGDLLPVRQRSQDRFLDGVVGFGWIIQNRCGQAVKVGIMLFDEYFRQDFGF